MHDRGFTCSTRASETNKLARIDLEVHVGEDFAPAVFFGDTRETDHGE